MNVDFNAKATGIGVATPKVKTVSPVQSYCDPTVTPIL